MKFTSTDERKPHPSYYTTFNNYNSTSAPTLLRAMDSDSDESIRHVRPPSSYGSMKSDGDEKKEDEEEEDSDSDSDSPCTGNVLFVPTAAPSGLQLNRSNYPETLHTQTTQETKPQDAYCIIDTKSEEEPELQQFWEDVEVEEEDFYRLNSPEPPPPVEDGEPMEEESQAERLHLELAMPHVFKNILAVLTKLSLEDLANFKAHLFREEIRFNLQEMLQWDSLDLVDKMIEVLGHENALKLSINGLESIRNETQAKVLKDTCKRVMLRIQLKKHILRRFKVLYEGVPRPGKQQPLDTIYVQPEISRRGPRAAAIDPASDDMGGDSSGFIDVKDLLRLCRASGELVKTLVTTGVPGIGLSVVAARFFMDWAEGVANKDIQFVIPLSFESLWSLQKTQPTATEKMSIMAVIGHYYQGFENVTYLEEQDCRFLILMDSFDCYLDALDWENTPVVSDSRAPANLDVLIVNLIRGNLLPSACLWILGRQGAVSNIPPELIDAVTDVHGFSGLMKDVYLCRRLEDPELSRNIVSHYKRTPTLETLCRQPFVCWLAATTFQRCYRYQGYGAHPPRLTPFYVHVMVIQTNRKLQRYRGQAENHLKWSSKDVNTLLRLGKMALALVKRQAWVFSQEDLRKHDLEDVQEITVYSGLCTELPLQDTFGKKQFRFIHNTFQEFMAAVYVFTLFHLEGRNALKEPSHGPRSPLPKLGRAGLSGSAGPTRSAADLLRGALQSAKQGSPCLDLVLRFLCGMVAPGNHNDVLRGKLLQAAAPRLTGLEAARDLLAQEAEHATEAERRANLKECLRELVQEDE